jgi:hypothetical protein
LKKIADDVKAGLSAIKAAALQARGDHARCFEKGSPAELILVSALAEGADRIAADAGLDLGYVLQSPLPFARAAYREDFKHKPPAGKENDPEALALAAEETKASCDEFDRLCGRAASVLELPGQHRLPADSEEVGQLRENRAYEAAGLTVLSHSDIVLVVWDRELSRGRGGTAYLIAEAVRVGLPIVLVDANGRDPVEIRWRNLMPHPAPLVAIEDLPAFDLADGIYRVVDELVRLPSADEQQTAFARWFEEKCHVLNPRIGYPLLTALLLVRVIKRADVLPRPPGALAQEYVSDGAPVVAPTAAGQIRHLAEAYGWADAVAFHYAQVFRSAFVMNFVFAALAVVAASASLLVHESEAHTSICDLQWWLPRLPVVAEIVLISFVVGNTVIGWWKRWHGRWVEAREVAERLRTALPLWALGLRPAFFPGEEPTWTGWYARAVVRMQGMRGGNLGAGNLSPERTLLLNLLTGQCNYNHSNAQRMRKMEHRLEAVGMLLLAATVVVAIDHFLGGTLMRCTIGLLLPAHEATIWLSAALPALATATYGIRVIGDFESHRHRAERTHRGLAQLIAAINQDPTDFGLLRARSRSAADAMLGDVSSWRLSAESRGLAIPG